MSNFLDTNIYGGDGFSSQELFGNRRGTCCAYTYDDVIIMPGHSLVREKDISLEYNITRNTRVKIPLLSSPMDTVTEHNMAIGMALQGAIGIIHYNMTIEEQAHEVKLVKKYKNGFINDPACLSADNVIADVDSLKEKFGYSGIPITVDGKMGSKLIGIVTNRDIDYVEDRKLKLSEVMTKGADLVTGKNSISVNFSTNDLKHILRLVAPDGVSLAQANELMRQSKKGKLPVVNTQGEIVALISRTG